jgi:hypothetical protein
MDKVAVILFFILLAMYVSMLEHAGDIRQRSSLPGVSMMDVIPGNAVDKKLPT